MWNQRRKWLACGAMSVILAVALIVLPRIDWSCALEAIRGGERDVLAPDGFLYVGCEMTEDGITTTTNDGYLVVEGANRWIGEIHIALNRPVGRDWRLQVFYSTEQQPYREDSSVVRQVASDEQSVRIPFYRHVKDLRIDLSDQAGLTFDLEQIAIDPGDYWKETLTPEVLLRALLLAMALFSAAMIALDAGRSLDWAYRNRWGIGLFVIALCVLLKLHGSSIGIYRFVLPFAEYEPIFGEPRGIRSDEYLVFTQMAFSQARDGFHWLSDCFRYSPMDMVMVYGQPVLDPVMLFRPFLAGYLLFGAERGLAFFWASRFVFAFLVSLEFGRIVTKENRALSAAYACMIALSPVLQWWFSVNALAEMLIFGQGALVLFKKYLDGGSLRRKALFAAGIVICACGYALTLYPAWEIPMLYVIGFCAICIIAEHRRDFSLKGEDVVICLIGVAAIAIGLAYVMIRGYGAIEASMNTVYPGKRTVLGGDLSQLSKLFRGWGNVFTPFGEAGLPEDACATADFFAFAPMGFILAAWLLLAQKKKDIWMAALGLNAVGLASYVCFQWPELLADLTLMGKSTPQRATVIVGFASEILLFRGLALLPKGKHLSKWIVAGVAGALAIAMSREYYGEYLTVNRTLALSAVVIVSAAVLLSGRNKLVLILCAAIGVAGGLSVNPISTGAGVLLDHPVVAKIDAINSEDEGRWFVDMDSHMVENLPTIVGASTVNSIHTYPDPALWERLGLEDQGEIWNRYSHFKSRISLEDMEKAELTLVQDDYLSLVVDLDMLRDLDVKYILSDQVFPDSAGVQCLYSYAGLYIYKR